MLWIVPLILAAPGDLAPGAQELDAAELRLGELRAATEAAGTATLRLQAAWTEWASAKGSPCDDHDRLSLGWRIERFGAAWREASQALRAQASRVRSLRAASTVAPLVDEARGRRIGEALSAADEQALAFLQASAWQVAYVRPVLGACPLAGEGLDRGLAVAPLPARGEAARPVAVLARGSGFVCPGAIPADDAVVLVAAELGQAARACWAADATCACEVGEVFPGAVLGPPVVEGTGEPPPG